MSDLDALVQIIAYSVKDVQAKSTERGLAYPTLDVPPSPETNKLQVDLTAQAAPAIAAAYQLIATLQHSRPYLLGMCFWPMFTGGLAFAEAAFVPDILREAGPSGMHVNEIAAVRNVSPNKLAHTLRGLATRHVFEEVSPDVFRNNRISAEMCTGKAVKEIVERPDDRWDGTNSLAAYVSLGGGILIRSASALVDNLTDPATAFSDEATKSPFARAHNGVPCYDWLDLPGNEKELKKFGIGMAVTSSHAGYAAVASGGFDWAELREGSKVVDVGGGVGNLAIALAKVHKHLRYIVQDRPNTAKEGEALWKDTAESSIVQFQGHDFFEEQPIKDAKVFVTRQTTHNWSDASCKSFLGRLREAAALDTKLIVIDDIQDYACRDSDGARSVPGAAKTPALAPLLPYPDTAAYHAYGMDLAMLATHNCQERTLGHFDSLLESAGWKLERVHRFPAPSPPQLVCSPL